MPQLNTVTANYRIMEFQDLSLIRGYHVHVYFDAETIEFAKTLCEEAGKLFSVNMPIYYLGWL